MIWCNEGGFRMIQDIAPHVFKNEYVPQKPEKDSYVMYMEHEKMLVKQKGEQISFPTFEELEESNVNIYEEATYLFAIDNRRFYLLDELIYDERYQWIEREAFRRMQPAELAFAGITAWQLKRWYQNHKFCGRCGKPMKKDKKERMLYCEACHLMEYPKICPAVIVGLTDGNRLLLTKYAGRKHKNYALIAGFAEIGETIEETVRREVMEEVGLKVKNITYYKSQPWSFTDTLLFGFYAELEGSPEIHLDEEELSVAEWFEREEIPINDVSVSLTNEMILNFKNGKNLTQL